MEENNYTGIVEDPRDESEVNKDFVVEEVASSYKEPVWLPKKQPKGIVMDINSETWRRFPDRDQDGSSRCVMETLAKMLGIDNYNEEKEFVELSSVPGYARRVNRNWVNSEGMVGNDALEIARDDGLPLEAMVKSRGVSEKDSNAYRPKNSHIQVAKVFRSGGYAKFTTKDMDRIASVIQNQGKGIMAWFRWDSKEYKDVPFIDPNSRLANHHSITLVDTILWEGKKAFVADESWGPGLNKFDSQRIITEDFFMKRNTFLAQTLDLANNWRDKEGNEIINIPVPKPKHVFMSDMEFSPVFNVQQEVKMLQTILRYEGLFPTHVNGQEVEISGYYGAITARAVLAFQEKHNVASLKELTALGGMRVGPKTRKVLNDLYA